MTEIENPTAFPALEEVLGYMEKYVARNYDDVDAIYSGFDRKQYKAAQETTQHWIKLINAALKERRKS